MAGKKKIKQPTTAEKKAAFRKHMEEKFGPTDTSLLMQAHKLLKEYFDLEEMAQDGDGVPTNRSEANHTKARVYLIERGIIPDRRKS